METIGNILKGVVFWVFMIAFSLGVFFGQQINSIYAYTFFVDIAKTKSAEYIFSPELKFSYSGNIFYKIDRWLSPSDYADVRHLEVKDAKAQLINQEKEYQESLAKEAERKAKEEIK